MAYFRFNSFKDIGGHTDSVVELAQLLASSGLKLNVSSLAVVGSTADPVSLIEAFDEDLSSTAKFMFKAHELLSTADANHYVNHLKSSDKDLRVIFGESYDPDKRSLVFSGCSIELDKKISVDEIKVKLVESILGVDSNEYAKFKKERNKLFKYNEANLSDDGEKVAYLSMVKSIDGYMDMIRSIRAIEEDYRVARSALGGNARKQLDRITGSRSMIDSVLETSTLVSSFAGVEFVSPKHRGHEYIVNKILDAITDGRYISATELDQDANVDSVFHAIKLIQGLKINVSDKAAKIFLKIRKLGNYREDGMFLDGDSIMAIDLASPSAIMRQVMKYVDSNNPQIKNSEARASMINALRSLVSVEAIVASGISAHKASGYRGDIEIISRMGEIGYILSKYNYNQDEAFSDFVERVRLVEGEYSSIHEISLVKPIDYYLENSPLYFNLAEMSPKMLHNIKALTSAYIGIDGKEPKEILDVRKVPEIKDTKRKPIIIANKYSPTSVSYVNSENLLFSLEYNKKHKVVDPAVFIKHVISQQAHVGRTAAVLGDESFRDQKRVMVLLAEWVREQNCPKINKALVDSVIKAAAYTSLCLYNKMEVKDRGPVPSRVSPYEKALLTNYCLHNNIKYNIKASGFSEDSGYVSENPLEDIVKNLSESDTHCWANVIKPNGGGVVSCFNEIVQADKLSPLVLAVRDIFNSKQLDEMIYALNQDDDLFFILANSTDKLRDYIGCDDSNKLKGLLASVACCNGLLEKIVDPQNDFHYNDKKGNSNSGVAFTKYYLLQLFDWVKLGVKSFPELKDLITSGKLGADDFKRLTPDVGDIRMRIIGTNESESAPLADSKNEISSESTSLADNKNEISSASNSRTDNKNENSAELKLEEQIANLLGEVNQSCVASISISEIIGQDSVQDSKIIDNRTAHKNVKATAANTVKASGFKI